MTAPLDDLDRRITAALQMNGRASWREVAALVGASENTVARRAVRLIDDGLLTVAVVREPRCAGLGHIANILVKCHSGRQLDVARALADRADVWALSVVTGAYDVFCQVTVPTAEDLARVLLHDVQRIDGVESTSAETTVRTFKLSYDWGRDLLGVPDQPAVSPVLHGETPHVLDQVDQAILDALAADARRSFAALADDVGVHESTVRRRFEVLRGRGCINIATFVPGRTLGFQPEMLLRLEVAPPYLKAAAAQLADCREVRYLEMTLGTVGLFGEVFLPSLDAVYDFTTSTIGSLPGVSGMHLATQLQTLKRGYVTLP